jgi:hypothetical protein
MSRFLMTRTTPQLWWEGLTGVVLPAPRVAHDLDHVAHDQGGTRTKSGELDTEIIRVTRRAVRCEGKSYAAWG